MNISCGLLVHNEMGSASGGRCMPVSICPRCQHVNPEYASYCFYDGSALHANQNAVVLRLPSEFVFPSGRRCGTFDELAQGCQEEWTAARDLLMRGGFEQFFRAGGRADLVRAAADAKAQANPDISLTTFLNALPGTRTQTPKLDLNPRRILLGNLLVGETKTVPLTITNQAHGLLQGTVCVTEGQDWLSLSETGPVHEIEISTIREQVVKLTIKTKGHRGGADVWGAADRRHQWRRRRGAVAHGPRRAAVHESAVSRGAHAARSGGQDAASGEGGGADSGERRGAALVRAQRLDVSGARDADQGGRRGAAVFRGDGRFETAAGAPVADGIPLHLQI